VLEYFYKNVFSYKISNLNFLINLLGNETIVVNNKYNPTFTLKQLKSLEDKDSEVITGFLVKKLYNIKEIDRDYNSKVSIVKNVLKSYNNDVDIYYNLINFLETKESEFEGRGEVRIKQLSSLFESKIFKDIYKVSNQTHSRNYLDFGGGDGEISAAISRYLNLNNMKAFTVDIQNWFGNIYENKYWLDVNYLTITTYEVPFNNTTISIALKKALQNAIKRLP
jgi:hypothetical protein